MRQFVYLSLIFSFLSFNAFVAQISTATPLNDPRENEVLKGSGSGLPKKYVTYPDAEEKQLAEAKGCANGERTYYDGCNTCSCPDNNGRNVSFCTYRLCMKRVVA